MKELKDKNGTEIKAGDFVFYQSHSMRGKCFGQVESTSRFILDSGEERFAVTVSGADGMVSYSRDIEVIA